MLNVSEPVAECFLFVGRDSKGVIDGWSMILATILQEFAGSDKSGLIATWCDRILSDKNI